MKIYKMDYPFRSSYIQIATSTTQEMLDFTSGKTTRLSEHEYNLMDWLKCSADLPDITFWNVVGGGRKLVPVLFLSVSGYLLSQGAYDVLKQAKLTGWEVRKTRVLKALTKKDLEGSPYYFLQAPVTVGHARFSGEKTEVNGRLYKKGLIVDMKGYNGADIFTPKGSFDLLTTRKWKDLFEKHFPKLFTFTPIEDCIEPIFDDQK